MKQDVICPGPLEEEQLSGAAEEFFRRIRPHRERLFDFYRREQPVPKGHIARGKPNNLLRVPFPRYITEVHTGYFLGLPLPWRWSGRKTRGHSRICPRRSAWTACSLTWDGI